jgi:peroxiredoxin
MEWRDKFASLKSKDMKKYLLLLSFCFSAGIITAQVTREDMFPKNAKYFIKEGPEIPYDKIDSVIISWGGRFGKIRSTGPDEEKIYLVPPNTAVESQEKKLVEKANGMVGKPAPDFDLTDMNGKQYRLRDLKGKVVVLNFWFTACVPCIAEMPELNSIKEKYKDREIVFLGLGRDPAERVKAFLKTHVFDYTLFPDAINTAEAYGISIYPTSIVIDRTGTVHYVQVTGTDIKESLSGEIDSVL